ncbi:predicted protein [Lichtheimia corymbifera JMRC:FSU:9682]|uniref:Ubiquitin-like domain-containing protein n=1 Tax=Lichtheimia corymbifera JMRC:FSU:9682 TaxID=1263082 RepID=A0A068SFF9_9FUNG|nr:predicted protein [Lichtheimia corymbifera JMRC:FSU:9682]
MESASSDTFTVQIRSPSLNETLTINTNKDASIRELKRLVHGIHPRNPHANDQRIIFGGRVLDDDEILGKILERADSSNIPTLHLVVKPSLTRNYASGSSSSITNNMPESSMPSSSQQTSTSQQQQPPSTPFFPTSQPQGPPQPQAVPGYPPLLPGGYQVVALNGQYYLAPVLVPTINPPMQSQHVYSQGIPAQGNNNLPANGHQQQQQQQPIRPRGNNAQQRAASVWLALKLIFILFILCQDASIERIIFFHAIAFVFFLYQTGRLRFVIRQVRPEDLHRNIGGDGGHHHHPQPQQAPPAAAPQQQQQQQPVTPPAEARGGNGAANLGNANEEGMRQRRPEHTQQRSATSDEQQPQQPATLLATLKRGAYTFVASLWPNYGHDARIAQALDNGQQEAWEGF